MGDRACYLAVCPNCDLQVSIVEEICPECGAELDTDGEQRPADEIRGEG